MKKKKPAINKPRSDMSSGLTFLSFLLVLLARAGDEGVVGTVEEGSHGC